MFDLSRFCVEFSDVISYDEKEIYACISKGTRSETAMELVERYLPRHLFERITSLIDVKFDFYKSWSIKKAA